MCAIDVATFDHNAGGGTNVVAIVKDTNSASNEILFSQCDWINNMSPLGAAVYISPGLWDFTVQGFLPVPLFTNCTFRKNTAYQELSVRSTPLDLHRAGVKMFSTGFGAIFISELHVQFEGHSTFSGNKGTAVYLSNGVLEFCEGSKVEFSKNKGGAIAGLRSFVSTTVQPLCLQVTGQIHEVGPYTLKSPLLYSLVYVTVSQLVQALSNQTPYYISMIMKNISAIPFL